MNLDAFVSRQRQTLEAGACHYGNTSFDRPLVDLIREIQDELVDVAGWGLILWSRLQLLRDRVAQAEQGGGDRG